MTVAGIAPILDEHFEPAGETALDGKNRVALSKAIRLLGPMFGDRQVRFSVYMNKVGQILLSPEVPVPAHQAWLYENPQALAQVRRGLAESGSGKVRDLGSFAKFADLDLDDEER